MSFNSKSAEYFPQDNKEETTSNSCGTADDINTLTSRDRPFACQVCNKRFTQKAHLIIHKRTHTGEKPYACHICHKRFAQSSHLTVHKRVHTGEKPFFCNYCNMGFCRRPRLEAHILQHVVKEGRALPSSLKGNMLKNVSMVGLIDSGSTKSLIGTNQESLDAAAQLMELKLKGITALDVKNEPVDSIEEDLVKGVIDDVSGTDKVKEVEVGRKRRKPEFVRRLGSLDDENEDVNNSSEADMQDDERVTNNKDYLNMLPDNISELHELQNPSFLLGSSKTISINNNIINSRTQHSTTKNPGLTMSGLVRTNNRISLVDFTAEDILHHLMTRDDVKSCDFCCIVFHDPAMYYLHRSMHDKMDVRCCNLCGKLLVDKYDFTAHFLSQHK
ncbi:zinc finger protein Xfin-like [Physella acuta]|uniref:zinc finger protein Xfin-like n=1 Tax=Physella acuta TaxID=109671 RepID=UPI0027DE854F|nr:zinc finger protein Xfin-like [Physella acuta]